MSITFVEIKYNEIIKFDYNGKKAKKKKKKNHFFISQLKRNWTTKENHKKQIKIKLKEQWKKKKNLVSFIICLALNKKTLF